MNHTTKTRRNPPSNTLITFGPHQGKDVGELSTEEQRALLDVVHREMGGPHEKKLRKLNNALVQVLDDLIPALLVMSVSDDEITVTVWCPYCRQGHTHGNMGGHRASHCGVNHDDRRYENFPTRDGYYLVA